MRRIPSAGCAATGGAPGALTGGTLFADWFLNASGLQASVSKSNAPSASAPAVVNNRRIRFFKSPLELPSRAGSGDAHPYVALHRTQPEWKRARSISLTGPKGAPMLDATDASLFFLDCPDRECLRKG